eukprot:480522-Hanusia_phi.AAC.3
MQVERHASLPESEFVESEDVSAERRGEGGREGKMRERRRGGGVKTEMQEMEFHLGFRRVLGRPIFSHAVGSTSTGQLKFVMQKFLLYEKGECTARVEDRGRGR